MNRWWKILVILLLMMSFFTTWMQLDNLKRFMAKGPRFTAKDGQELCERVRALEQVSYDYRDAGKKPMDCKYLERK